MSPALCIECDGAPAAHFVDEGSADAMCESCSGTGRIELDNVCPGIDSDGCAYLARRANGGLCDVCAHLKAGTHYSQKEAP